MNTIETSYKYNDGGRSIAGYKGLTGDCGVRAIAIATGLDYQHVYNLVKQFAEQERFRKRKKSSPRSGIWVETMKKIMDHLGWEWVGVMGIGTGCRMTLKEVPNGRIICRVSKHYVAVINGQINDTYDPSRGGTRCVYGYWKQC